MNLIFQIPVRGSLRDINPKLVSVLAQLRNTHKVPLSGCLEVFLCVANGFFGQTYKHGIIFILNYLILYVND